MSSTNNIILAELSNKSTPANNILHGSNNDSGMLKLKILADGLENKLEDAAALLEITGNLSVIRSIPNSNLLNTTLEALHGIPENADIEKRGIAQNILANYNDFAAIAFIMPNGDMYLVEPYSEQVNQTRNNYASRDYFKGAIETNDTYIGDIITSASSGLKEMIIAVPVYSSANGSVEGIWAGAIDVGVLNNELQSLNLKEGQRIVYVDSNGTKIADSDKKVASNATEYFSNLKSFQNAISGTSGFVVEEVKQTPMLVSYHPVKALQNTWAVLWIQPASRQ